MPSLPLSATSGSYSAANKRASSCSIQRVYPWLLFASTAVAATFCLAYITKPVILAGPSFGPGTEEVRGAASGSKPVSLPEKLIPDETSLPGERPDRSASVEASKIPPASFAADFEETNIRMQHILDAESPSGDISRIVIDVPVLYESRNLRWTQEEAAQARILLQRLTEHQEKTRSLRDEGKMLLQAWNDLMDSSIPEQALRADSPSLPENQMDLQRPVPSTSADIIKIQNKKD